MAADYDFRENPNPTGDGTKQALHPRIVVKDTIETEHIINDICRASTFSPGDLSGAICELGDRIVYYLTEGYNVEIKGLGYFSASLKSRPVMDAKEIRASSVSFDTVNFRPSAQLKKKLRMGNLARSKHGFNHSKDLPEEEKRARVMAFLDKHPFMSRKDYCAISGRLKGMALKDLNEWVKEGFLKKYGVKSSTVYLKG